MQPSDRAALIQKEGGESLGCPARSMRALTHPRQGGQAYGRAADGEGCRDGEPKKNCTISGEGKKTKAQGVSPGRGFFFRPLPTTYGSGMSEARARDGAKRLGKRAEQRTPKPARANGPAGRGNAADGAGTG